MKCKVLEAIHAFIFGKEIQCRKKNSNDEWRDLKNPIWNYEEYEYKIKDEKK